MAFVEMKGVERRRRREDRGRKKREGGQECVGESEKERVGLRNRKR